MCHLLQSVRSDSRQAFGSPLEAGPPPATTPLHIRREETSLLHTWKKPF